MVSMVELARALGVIVVGVPALAGGADVAWVPEHRIVMVLESLSGRSLDDAVAWALDRAQAFDSRPA